MENWLKVPYIKYIDECFSVLMLLYLLLLAARRMLSQEDSKILGFLAAFTVIGVISNLVSGLNKNIFQIALAAFWQWKIFVAFLGAKYLCRHTSRERLFSGVLFLAKCLILAAAVCGTINLFKDIGMAEGWRYGLPSFYFVFRNHGRYGIIIAVAMFVVLMAEKRKREIGLYTVLGLYDMILSTKGIVYIIIPVFLLLWFVFRTVEKNGEAKIWVILLSIVAAVAVSGYQITEYVNDTESPRMLLIIYGFVTANTYFPFGAGFGTYGSEVASSNYSPLYVQYGWADKWSMGRESNFALNDNHLATIIGESGYFGLALFLYLIYCIYKQVNRTSTVSRQKALLLSLFFCMFIAFLGTGIAKSSIGVLVFMIFGIMVGTAGSNDTDAKHMVRRRLI